MIVYIYDGKEHKGKAGEELLRKALKDYSGNAYTGIVIKREKYGKPYFENIPVQFSISHSGQIWVCLMADFNVGIDIQFYKNLKYEKIAERFFTENEIEYIHQKGIDGFFQVWTRKEAYVKYTGNGFANEGFSDFSVVSKEGNNYFLKKTIGEAYFQELDLPSDKCDFITKSKLVGVTCSRVKEFINIKILGNEGER
ncbi:4'-phosphopantetheinyl transferase family protein [Aminipila terrae]|uniref:4'-phosphopantetheinyl transferase superfamily protein n=1 Tax=Aminipila terrae TaxID=2697030 RepID=A0A6P1MGU6_9FIRM|nr:4'-phosphopantetheinyl transferase superfamily protein [Aminipila terrae]QHI71238.1 4'-phosphopantetheinyl transferase superfamily protein [Aminipila terrae]